MLCRVRTYATAAMTARYNGYARSVCVTCGNRGHGQTPRSRRQVRAGNVENDFCAIDP